MYDLINLNRACYSNINQINTITTCGKFQKKYISINNNPILCVFYIIIRPPIIIILFKI